MILFIIVNTHNQLGKRIIWQKVEKTSMDNATDRYGKDK